MPADDPYPWYWSNSEDDTPLYELLSWDLCGRRVNISSIAGRNLRGFLRQADRRRVLPWLRA